MFGTTDKSRGKKLTTTQYPVGTEIELPRQRLQAAVAVAMQINSNAVAGQQLVNSSYRLRLPAGVSFLRAIRELGLRVGC